MALGLPNVEAMEENRMQVLILFLLMALPLACFAAEKDEVKDDTEDVLVLHSGEVYQGVILERSPGRILFSTRQYEVRAIDPSEVRLHRLDRSAARKYNSRSTIAALAALVAYFTLPDLLLEDNPETGEPDLAPRLGIGSGAYFLVHTAIRAGTYKPSRKEHRERYMKQTQIQLGASPSGANMRIVFRF